MVTASNVAAMVSRIGCISVPRGGVAEGAIEPDCLADQSLRNRGIDGRAVAKLQRLHLIFAGAGHARLDVEQPLAAPEAKQHAFAIRPDQEGGSVRYVDEVAPFDGFVA